MSDPVCEHSLLRKMMLPTETKVESGTSQSKSGTSVNLSNIGLRLTRLGTVDVLASLKRNGGFDDAGELHV